ncbi:hypothetical protein MAR_014660 [Mya arenaria]|uniref:Uncharacterized protein n=1 Tax=Mya arenaria TaxID=6604 RepID=A0ABY7FIC0_MYAAR|nr:hypothetical protein MAR_014660 [Mya arenaria]
MFAYSEKGYKIQVLDINICTRVGSCKQVKIKACRLDETIRPSEKDTSVPESAYMITASIY